MNQNRFAKRVVVLAGFVFLCVGPGLAGAQSSRPYTAQTPPKTSPAARPKRDTPPTDYFAGLTFTDDQKAKIDEIHRNTKSRMDTVDKDKQLDAEQKGAMRDGYRRLENGQIYRLLTPEQRTAVRGKIRAQKLAAQQENEKKQSPPK
jgi:Spy/CpxP family protein refolding chaperone